MRIGIIGTGNVGSALGIRWAQGGHEVVFGTRDPNSPKTKQLLAQAGANARAALPVEAAKAGEIVLLATPWDATKDAIESLGDLGGKILIDAVNPLRGIESLEVGTTTSAGELVAQWAHGAKTVKTFNTVGANIMANPGFGTDRPVLFYCGDDATAKQKVRQLVDELGFEAVDAGPMTQARVLEPFALLWISLAYQAGLGREIGFKLLRR
jgi:NADPH-dependent F420 reductase